MEPHASGATPSSGARPADHPELAAGANELDLRERSRTRDGRLLVLDRRLYGQLHAWAGARDPEALIPPLERAGVCGVLYHDLHDPAGIALLALSEAPEFFVGPLRRVLNSPPFATLVPKPELTMFGRTYAVGHEPDLEQALLLRPRDTVLDPENRWAVWYPLRRAGSFERLSPEEKREIMIEHGSVGLAFGRAGLARDIRLACHGLDRHDNDFVIGLVGPELHPLSAVVQQMRGTRQTSLHLERLGPFFVGRVAWQGRPGETPAPTRPPTDP